jgi:hypothetical protein
MKIGRAAVAGLVGCVVVLLMIAIAGMLSGADADLCALGGAVVTGREGATSWVIGLVAQLAIAIIAALAYAAVFEWVVRRGGAIVGAVVALGHVVVAGIAAGFLPVGGLLSAGKTPPGAFLEYRGWVVVGAFVLAHLAFGAIVGALYGTSLHRVSPPSAIWRDVTIESTARRSV